jgi:hypothetical protein
MRLGDGADVVVRHGFDFLDLSSRAHSSANLSISSGPMSWQ